MATSNLNVIINANHLSIPEINFELLCRQVIPAKNDSLQRAQLRAILANEKEVASKKLVQPYDFDTNVSEIQNSISELQKIVADGSPTHKDCLRVQSRIAHLNARLALLAKTATDKEQKDVVAGFLSDVLAVQGMILSHVEELSDFTPILSSTVESDASATRSLPKAIPVYKWGIKFSGQDARESVMSFLEKVDDLRGARHLSERDLFVSSHDLFSGLALQWHRNIKSEVGSWKELVKCLKRDFLPFDYEFDLLNEIRNRTQGANENVCVYIVAMEALFKRLDKQTDDADIVRQIVRNLNPFFSQHLALQNITELPKLKDTCRQIQDLKLRAEKYKPPPQKRAGLLEPDLACVSLNESTFSSQISAFSNMGSKVGGRGLCWNCNGSGHAFNTCTGPRKVFCYGCGESGVYKSQCRKCSPASADQHNSRNFVSSGNGRRGSRDTGAGTAQVSTRQGLAQMSGANRQQN